MKTIYLLPLLKQEWRLFYRRHSNIALMIIFTLITIVACVNGVTLSNKETNEVKHKIEQDQVTFSNKVTLFKKIESGEASPGKWNDPRKAHQGVLHSSRPAIPSSAELPYLSAESQKLTPSVLGVGMSSRHTNPKPILGDPSGRLYGAFDLIFVIVWLLPLFIIIVSYDVISQDRTQGSIGILLSQNTSLYRITFTRLILRFILFAIILTVVSLISLMYLASDINMPQITGLFIWLLAVFSYMGIWFSLSALANTLTKNVASAGLILLSCWIASTLIIPASVGAFVKAVAPPIDRHQAILDLRALSSELNKKRQQVTNDYYADNPESKPQKGFDDEYSEYFIKVRYPAQIAFDSRYKPLAQKIENKRIQQIEYLRIGSFLSPTLALKLLSDDLSGKSPERRQHFLHNVDKFQNSWRKKFAHKVSALIPLTLDDYKTKPEFAYKNEDITKRSKRLFIVFIALVLPFIGLFFWTRQRLKQISS